jgi:hypothetical protein
MKKGECTIHNSIFIRNFARDLTNNKEKMDNNEPAMVSKTSRWPHI